MFRFLLTQPLVDPNAVQWNEYDFSGSFGSLCTYPLKRARLVRAIEMLVGAGANARDIFEMFVNTRRHVDLTVSCLRFFGQDCNLDIQSATQPKIREISEGRRMGCQWSERDHCLLLHLQEVQRKRWAWIDQIDAHVSLAQVQESAQTTDDIQARLTDLKNRHGREAIHVAAAFNRKDVLQCLVCDVGIDPTRPDEHGKSALQLAHAAGSHDVQQFLRIFAAERVIARFAQKAFRMRRHRRAFRRVVHAANVIQGTYKACVVFRATHSLVRARLGERQQFMHMWGPLVKSLAHRPGTTEHGEATCWVSLKTSLFDFSRSVRGNCRTAHCTRTGTHTRKHAQTHKWTQKRTHRYTAHARVRTHTHAHTHKHTHTFQRSQHAVTTDFPAWPVHAQDTFCVLRVHPKCVHTGCLRRRMRRTRHCV